MRDQTLRLSQTEKRSLPWALPTPGFSRARRGRLTEYPIREPTLYLVYLSRKYLPLKSRAFVDFILETISKGPSPKVARRVDSSQE